ncbi:hypothetical protein [Nostoc piscinale]|uniref:hypothetical protein n=1 Tax=Nostoc piscinale TaxID=224012 RepID=UPI0039A61621
MFKLFLAINQLLGKYQPIIPNPQGLLWSQQLELYLGVHQETLRFYTPEEQLVPTPEEVAQQELERAEQQAHFAEQTRELAEQSKQRSDRLAAKLRELNIDPDAI